MYLIRSPERNEEPDSKYYKFYAYLVKLKDGLPILMYGYRTSQLARYPMTFNSHKDAAKYFELFGIHRLDLWLKSNNLTLARVRETKAIPGLADAARDYRKQLRSIAGASAMLRKSLTDAGYSTIAQLVYHDIGKVLDRLKLEYDDKANRIAGQQGKQRRIRKC